MAGVLEQDPYTLPDGRLVGASHLMPGLHICPVYTDDPTGHHGWQRADFESEDAGKQSRELEPSQYVQPNGTIVMLFRDQKSTFCKLASVSDDRGEIEVRPGASRKSPTFRMPVPNNVQATCPMALLIWSVVLQTANGAGLWFYCLVRMVSGLTKRSCSAVVRLMTCLPDAMKVDTRPWASTIPRLSCITIPFMSATLLTRKTWIARSFLWQKWTKNR